jgi:DTW domain-containing protein YfiP
MIPQCCARCRLRPEVCVCAVAPRLDISTRLIVIIHSKEWRKSTNTGYLARLATRDGEVRLHGLPHRTLNTEGIDAGSASSLVLFPGHGAEPLTTDLVVSLPRPLTLLVPDGNWMQAKNMMRRVRMLNQARPVRLDGSSLNFQNLRHNACAGRMSTFEAIAQALGILEGQAIADHLLDFFRQVVGRMTPNYRRMPGRNVLI